MMLLRARTLLLVATLALLSPALFASAYPPAQEDVTWTLMMYMAADGDSTLPWEDDINEMEEAEESDRVNVIALVDPDGPGNSILLRIRHDEEHLNEDIVSDLIDDGGAVLGSGEVNTGAPDTLRAFIEFVAASFPADRYVLFLWGHGGGWFGLCPDGQDVLRLPELRYAIASATEAIDRPLDMVVVDACAEGVVETMYEICQDVLWLVASEKSVPLSGLPYGSIIGELVLNPGMSVEEFGTVIVDKFVRLAWYTSPYSVNMSLFNLSAVEALVDVIDGIAAQAVRFDRLFHNAFLAAYVTAETYDLEHYVDLGDLLYQIMRREVPLEVKKLGMDALEAYLEVVAYTLVYSNPDPMDGIKMESASGAAIYFANGTVADAGYSDLLISETRWDEFTRLVRDGGPQLASESGPEIAYHDSAAPQDLPDWVTLTWQQDYAQCYAWVFRDTPNGLMFVTSVASESNQLVLSGLVGSFMVAASAGYPNVTYSYRILNISLYGLVEIEAVLVHLGTPAAGGYALELVTSSGSYAFEAADGRHLCSLVLPADAQVMELARVVVRDADTGRVVGIAWTTVLASSFNVHVNVLEYDGGAECDTLLLLVSLSPAVAILCVALALAARRRGRP